MEAVVATVIAVLAAIGLAYAFGIGRGNVNRFEAARMADAQAQGRMEYLVTLIRDRPASDSLKTGTYPSVRIPFVFHGQDLGHEYWRVDHAPTTVPPSIQAGMSLLTVDVEWTMGGLPDTARYQRLFGH